MEREIFPPGLLYWTSGPWRVSEWHSG